MRYFTIYTGFLLVFTSTTIYGQQRPAGHPPVPNAVKPVRSANGNPTPHEYARQLRATVPAEASFRYKFGYVDATEEDITDSLLVATDTRRIEYVRVSRATGQPVGMARMIHWPSGRDAGEGKVKVSSNGELSPVGHWVIYYDAPGKHKEMEMELDPQGQVVPGTLQHWNEDGTLACQLRSIVLPNTRRVVHSQYNVETSDPNREIVAVDLPQNTASFTLSFDIRDGDAPPAFWGAMANAALNYASGGAAAVVQAAVVAKSPPANTTKSYYFITDDADAAERFRSTGELPKVALHYTRSAIQEQPTITLKRPAQQVWICVVNENLRTAATLSLYMEATADFCGNAPR